MIVVVLGASHKASRFSNKAVRMLASYGHIVIPVHPKLGEVEGLRVFNSLAEVEKPVDTVTVYVNPEKSSEMITDILELSPSRVIFNPGSENQDLINLLEENGIHTVSACTLVLLRAGEFETV
ncbi:MAG: putative CoA-binding protein [Candidatus Marinamargulisbacteria bacterium]|jgi:predicted CoA-binding protein